MRKTALPPLIEAVIAGDHDSSARLAAIPEETQAVDSDGRTALHHAVIQKRASLVALLLSHGAKVNVADRLGFTPLHYAAQEHAIEEAGLLLKATAPVDAENMYGNTPLFVAVFNSRGRGEVIKLLLQYGANPDHQNKSGSSPRKLAKLIANYNVAQFLEGA